MMTAFSRDVIVYRGDNTRKTIWNLTLWRWRFTFAFARPITRRRYS